MREKYSYPMAFEYGIVDNAAYPSQEMMKELTQVLKKYQALNRFGLTRIEGVHAPGRVMSESCLPEQRLLVTAPKEKILVDPTTNLETQWRLDVPGMLKACASTCVADTDGHSVLAHKGNE